MKRIVTLLFVALLFVALLSPLCASLFCVSFVWLHCVVFCWPVLLGVCAARWGVSDHFSNADWSLFSILIGQPCIWLCGAFPRGGVQHIILTTRCQTVQV